MRNFFSKSIAYPVHKFFQVGDNTGSIVRRGDAVEKFDSKELAGKYYDESLENSTDEVSQGLKLTHEQVTNYYMGGTVDDVIERQKGKDIPLEDL